MALRRPAAALLLILAALLMAGCGGDDDGESIADQVRTEVREQTERLREEIETRADRIRKRIEDVLGQIEQAVPRAERTSREVQSRGRTEQTEIDAFLTRIIEDVDKYWTRTLRASNIPEPRVSYAWIPPGRRVSTGCGIAAGDDAAFYCPADDTIYIAQRFASDLFDGVAQGLPGQSAGFGRAAGDFGVAYVVAHEYAHNLQDELGFFTLGRSNSSKPFELQADCMAGAWGNSVYAQGRLQEGDIEEAVGTAQAVGDFDFTNANHHGTPEERREAWLAGFESGDPSVCERYVPR
jgi:predicted metalloprotease